MKLLLFDIDGTILRSRGTGRQAVEKALEHVIGRPIQSWQVTFSGRTDPQIIRDVLIVNGCTPVEADAYLEQALEAYVETALTLLDPERIRLMPGVQHLIEQLVERTDVQLALLTGNMEPMAYAKLEAVSLAHHFPFGAFASDHADRYQLPAIAVGRARAYTGRDYRGKDIVIIGDTEHDIRCGHTLGVCSVAVATGHFSITDLARHEPDYLFEDLSDPTAFLDMVLSAT